MQNATPSTIYSGLIEVGRLPYGCKNGKTTLIEKYNQWFVSYGLVDYKMGRNALTGTKDTATIIL